MLSGVDHGGELRSPARLSSRVIVKRERLLIEVFKIIMDSLIMTLLAFHVVAQVESACAILAGIPPSLRLRLRHPGSALGVRKPITDTALSDLEVIAKRRVARIIQPINIRISHS